MSNNLAVIEQVMIKGDLSALQPQQKVEYYAKVCESVGLNPLTKPFEYIKLNGKEVLYATKGATEQLRNIAKISIKITAREKIEDVYVVTAEAVGADGRCDSATGAVAVGGLKGDALANAFMKAETKAKRRVTLSICGLNMLDETEVETIPEKQKQVTSITMVGVEPKKEEIKNVTLQNTAKTVREPINQPSFDETSDGTDDGTFSFGGRGFDSGHFNESNGINGKPYDDGYVIQIGFNKGKTFEEAGYENVYKSYSYLYEKEQKGERVEGYAKELLNKAKPFLDYIKSQQ